MSFRRGRASITYLLLPGRIGLTCLLHPRPLVRAGVQDASRNSPSAVEGAAVPGLAPLPVLQLLPGRHCQIIGACISSRAVPSSNSVGHSLARCRRFHHRTEVKGHEYLQKT